MSVLDSPEYVSAGSRMVWTGQFGGGVLPWSPDEISAAIKSSLANKYSLAVEKEVNNIPWLALSTGSITLYLRTDIDRGDGETDDGLTDILHNVDDEFKAEHAPLVTSVLNSYTPPANPQQSGGGAGATVNTGAVLKTVDQQVATGAGPINNPISSWWDGLVSKVEAGSVGFAVGAIAVVSLIIVIVVHSET